MPYNSKEWSNIVYRGNKLIGIKRHKNKLNNFMFEVNIKAIRKRKFVTMQGKGEELLRGVIDEYALFRQDIQAGYFTNAKTFEDLFKRMILIKSVSLRWQKLQEATFKNHICKYIGQKNINDIRSYDIDEVMIKVRDKAPATRKAIMNIIKSVLRYAQENKFIKDLPVKARHNISVNSLQQKTIVTDPQDKFIRVYNAINALYDNDPVIKSIFLFGLYGRRKTEVLKMQWKHIDFINCQYTVPGVNSKVKTDFIFSLPKEISDTLQRIPGSKKGLIFKNPMTKQEYTNIQKHIKNIRNYSRWEKFTFHRMRNLLASTLHSQGVSTSYISSILGHTNSNTVNQYLSMERTLSTIEDEINKIISAKITETSS